tara:strand:- start:52 stop:216 length:165 start_codon:yes stop_codon:yes gene_type:complete
MENSTKVFNSKKNLNPIIGKQLAVKIAQHDYRKGLISLGEVDEAEFALGKQLNK